MKIAFIIINYNQFEKTIECVNSILQNSINCKFDIYILDNNSNNNSVNILEEEYKNNENISIILSSENLGYARGNNYLLKIIENKNYDYAIISNNDIIYFEESVNILIDTISNDKDVIIVAPRVININKALQVNVKFKKTSFFEYMCNVVGIKSKTIPKKRLKNISEVYWVAGCSFIVDLNKLHQIGYFDSYTFLYFEEYILSAKIEKANYKMLFQPNAEVFHYHKASTSKNNIDISLHFLRSELYYWKKYRKITYKKLYFLVFLRNCFIRIKYRKNQDAVKKYKKESARILDKIYKEEYDCE